MSGQRFRRRLFLIDSEIQVQLGARLAFYLAGYMALFLGIALISPVATVLTANGSETEVAAAAEKIRTILLMTLLPLAFATACAIVHSIRLLHRLAGPVYRLRESLAGLRDKDLTCEIHLREGDLVGTLVDNHNEALASLRGDVEKLKGEVDGALAEKDLNAGVEKRLRRMSRVLGNYTLSKPTPAAVGDGSPEPASSQEG